MDKDWSKRAMRDYLFWEEHNQSIAERIKELLEDIELHPFEGKGQPEPLKWDLAGYWSRRITQKHRLVYKVTGNDLHIYMCRGHYE
jgi:toxin YoeB